MVRVDVAVQRRQLIRPAAVSRVLGVMVRTETLLERIEGRNRYFLQF